MTENNTSNHSLAPPQLSEGQLELLFRRLNLANTPRIYQQVADRAEKENWSYRDFLAFLLAEEVAHRKQTRLQRCTRNARFPFFKTIDEFDFSLQTTLRQAPVEAISPHSDQPGPTFRGKHADLGLPTCHAPGAAVS